MRQVVNGAKGGPLLGHSSCIALNPYEEKFQDRRELEDSINSNSSEDQDHEEENIHRASKSKGPRQQIERERRLRREIANSNERRRMQSINQGYMSLKEMLPMGDGGEKLSKAAVLQNAADYMAQILEERKQLLIRNNELTQALNSQRQFDSGGESTASSHKRRKLDTESSDEGISMSYQSPKASHESDLVEELRRTVSDLRLQLEREAQRRTLLEQSYTAYYSSFVTAQAAAVQQQAGSTEAPTMLPLQLTPLHSHHTPTEQQIVAEGENCHGQPACSPPTSHQQGDVSADRRLSSHSEGYGEPLQTFGKASSVASQNLSIIVEAINHLEGDGQVLTGLSSTDKEADSGVSHGESSDDNKSEGSGSDTPQPPPAHQSALISHHKTSTGSSLNYSNSTALQTAYSVGPLSAASPTAAVPLVYRPTFLSNYMTAHSQPAMPTNYISVSQHPQRHHSL